MSRPSCASIELWIELCEIRSAAARMNATRLDGLETGRTENVRAVADHFDDLAQFLREILPFFVEVEQGRAPEDDWRRPSA